MSISDPISDMLAKIKNAMIARHVSVDIPSSKMKIEMMKIFKNEGYIKNFRLVDSGVQGKIRVFLKYLDDKMKTPVINDIKRVSKPGLRKYSGKEELPRIFNGMGSVVLSTSKGLITGKKAKHMGIGGEIICYIW